MGQECHPRGSEPGDWLEGGPSAVSVPSELTGIVQKRCLCLPPTGLSPGFAGGTGVMRGVASAQRRQGALGKGGNTEHSGLLLLLPISVSEKHSRPSRHGPPRGGHIYLRDSRAGQRWPWVAPVSEGHGPCLDGHPRASRRPVVATCKDPTAEPRGAGEGPGCRGSSGACSRGR